jgi:glycosyltransferase involved in cell wall biosynthesis
VAGYYPLEFWGGGEIVLVRVMNHLGARYDVEYLAPEGFGGPLRADAGSIMSGARFRYRRIPFARASALPGALLRPVPPRWALEGADLVMVPLDRPPSAALLRELEGLGVPAILMLHGLTFEKFSAASPWNLAVSAYQAWARLYMRSIAGALRRGRLLFQVLNESQRSFLEGLGVERSRILLIPNTIDFSNYRVSRDDGTFRVVYMGRIDRLVKGAHLLARVARGMARAAGLGAPVELLIMGSGPAEGSVARLASGPGVRFLGQVNDQRAKSELLSSGNLMISLSNTEAFSVSLLEGLASGLPVLCTDTSGPRYIVGRNPAFGRVLGFSAREFMGAILEYYARWRSDPGGYFAEKLERRRAAEEEFGRARMEELYESAVEMALGLRFQPGGLHSTVTFASSRVPSQPIAIPLNSANCWVELTSNERVMGVQEPGAREPASTVDAARQCSP